MPLLSDYARRKKENYFLDRLSAGANVLEVGSKDGWVGELVKERGCLYTGMDLFPPADIVGDIKHWKALGLEPNTYDAIVAFEVVEHVDCFQECYDLLKPGGRMFITTPRPKTDWVLKVLEALGLNQKRTSPHDFLVDLTKVSVPFREKQVTLVGGLSQWAIFTK